MNANALKAILIEELGSVESGDTVDVPSDRKLTVLLRLGDELVPVSKVRSVRFTKAFVNIVGESDQFFVDTDCDFLLKSEDAQKREDGRPGFH